MGSQQRQVASFLSSPVLIHGELLCITFCLSGFTRPTLCSTTMVPSYLVNHRTALNTTKVYFAPWCSMDPVSQLSRSKVTWVKVELFKVKEWFQRYADGPKQRQVASLLTMLWVVSNLMCLFEQGNAYHSPLHCEWIISHVNGHSFKNKVFLLVLYNYYIYGKRCVKLSGFPRKHTR